VGGTLGTAIIAVVLQDKLVHVPGAATGRYTDPTALAAAFADTYQWVILMTVIALIPAAVLWRVERVLRASGQEAQPSEESLIEAIV
jgi:hypothetical protein